MRIMMKQIDKLVEKQLGNVIRRYDHGGAIIFEIFSENYFNANAAVLKGMVKSWGGGIFISSQRPFKNISMLLKQKGINIKEVFFVDIATALSNEMLEKNKNCIHISKSITVDELTSAVYTSFLSKLKSRKKFIVVDSLTTMVAYNPLFIKMIKRLVDFLIGIARKNEALLIMCVSKEGSGEAFIKEISKKVDEVISL
jgi:predicted glycosyltransferase involved in capsule biosynthesis